MPVVHEPAPGFHRIPLPGGVWLDGDDAPRRTVELRAPGDIDQVAILDTHALPPAIRATELLSRCLDDGNRIAPALSVGDREAALLHLRRLTLGDALEAVVSCPACGARLEAELRVSDLLVEPYADLHRSYAVTADTPAGPCTVTFRLPTCSDLRAVAHHAPEDMDTAANVLLQRCVLGAETGGESDAELFSSGVRSAVAAAMATHDPQAELALDMRCPACGLDFSVGFDAASYVLRELDERASTLLADVHAIASRYHWSERDILALPPSRRARYMDLIGAATSLERGR